MPKRSLPTDLKGLGILLVKPLFITSAETIIIA